jgi:hypothetical protein
MGQYVFVVQMLDLADEVSTYMLQARYMLSRLF